jgi:hypothetical protein
LVGGEGGWGNPVDLAIGDTATQGVAETGSRSDHVHGMPAFGSPESVSTAPAAGTAVSVSRSDHVHDIGDGAINDSLMLGSDVVTNAKMAPNSVGTDQIVNDAVTSAKIGPAAVDNTALATNSVSQAKMQDNSVGQAELRDDAVGVAEIDAAVYGTTATNVVPEGTSSPGVATTLSRSDHQHGSTAAAPVSLGTGNSEGSSSSFARSDHVHDVGDARTNVIKGGYNHSSLTVSTTWTSRLSESISLPSGWGSMLVVVSANLQAVNTGAGTPQLESYIKIGSFQGSTSQSGSIAASDEGISSPTYSAVVSASSTLAVWARITSGACTGKYINYTWFAIKAS